MTRNSPIASRLIFPVVMGLSLGLVFYLVKVKGFEINMVSIVIAFCGLLSIGILERLFPYREDWNTNDGDIGNDIVNVIITQTIIPKLFTPLSYIALAAFTAWIAKIIGNNLWPHHWNLFGQLALVLVIAEFGRYWVHRWAHTIPLLWRFHAVHHSPNRLYLLNAARFHPIEKVFFLMPEVVPFILLGTNAEALGMYAVFNSIHGLFQHSNIELKLGWLNYIFSMAELHRFHHSKIIKESNSNYGNNLIIWDIVFGTFYYPKNRGVGTIGLFNPEYPKDYIGQLKAPFRGDIDKPDDYYQRIAYYEKTNNNKFQ